MLVVVNANGRLGVELVKQARAQGIPVRPVVRDDQDTDQLDKLIPVSDIFYGNPEHPSSFEHALEGARWVVSCVDPRIGGPGSPIPSGEVAAHVIRAADAAGAEIVLHLSIMGAYRWSYAALNRKSFHLESAVRTCASPWAILRFSCFFDELLEAHLRPPDGGQAHALKPASRYAPCSRADAARSVLRLLESCPTGRALCLGGPTCYSGSELERLLSPHRQGAGKKTAYLALPPGDVSVAPETTRSNVGWIPEQTLEGWLESVLAPSEGSAPSPTVYPKGDPESHPADRCQPSPVTLDWGSDLRRVLHTQLVEDLDRLGLSSAEVQLDFSAARPEGKAVKVHGGELRRLQGVTALTAQGASLKTGGLSFVRDRLAEELHVWWTRSDGQIPEEVWTLLDMGVRRRIAADPEFKDDEKVRAFLQSKERWES